MKGYWMHNLANLIKCSSYGELNTPKNLTKMTFHVQRHAVAKKMTSSILSGNAHCLGDCVVLVSSIHSTVDSSAQSNEVLCMDVQRWISEALFQLFCQINARRLYKYMLIMKHIWPSTTCTRNWIQRRTLTIQPQLHWKQLVLPSSGVQCTASRMLITPANYGRNMSRV